MSNNLPKTPRGDSIKTKRVELSEIHEKSLESHEEEGARPPPYRKSRFVDPRGAVPLNDLSVD